MTSRLKTYRWEFRAHQTEHAQALAERYRLHSIVASVLANRGYGGTAPEELAGFMQPRLSSLHDPFLMKDMEVAVQRTATAIRNGETIVVFGDYDADGITSTAVMTRGLRFAGAACSFYVPHRIDEGYGLNTPALEKLAHQGTNLVITVDNGISGHDAIARANELGMDVIVTDHHQPGDTLPPALAVVNPNRRDCTYPCPHLTGVGVAFKFIHALLKEMGRAPDESINFLRSLLDLVAVGTVADYAPLVGENRVLVSHGLQRIANSSNVGMSALRDALKLPLPITAMHIAFQIAPRLNAAGRTSHAEIGVDLLMTDDLDEASSIVRELEECNKSRKQMETRITGEALKFVKERINLDTDHVIVVDGHNWHLGVIGIVAARVMDELGRPVIALSHMSNCVKGSARSVGAFNLYEALTHCESYLTAYGGHPNAAGLTLPAEKVPAFREAINEYARTNYDLSGLCTPLVIDAEVKCGQLDMEMMSHLSYLEPFGQSNPQPVLASRGVRLNAQPRVVGDRHLKLQFASEDTIIEGIGFNLGYMAHELNGAVGAPMDVVFSPSVNTYWSVPRVEMEVKDLRLQVS